MLHANGPQSECEAGSGEGGWQLAFLMPLPTVSRFPLPPSTTSCTYLSKLTSRKCCTFLAMDHGAGIPTMCRLDKGHLSPVIKASQQQQKPTEARELLRLETQFLLQLQLHLQLRSPVDNIKEVLKLVVDRGLIL